MALSGWDRETSPYHPGEQALHTRLGRRDKQERIARRIHRTFLPDQHREFYAQLPFFVAGSVDRAGWPWASVLFGRPGFVATPDATTLTIATRPIPGDALADHLAAGDAMGFLGIELATRRRNRVNGVVSRIDDSGFEIDVVQSFGNCPQYIQTRDLRWIRDADAAVDVRVEAFTALGDEVSQLIRGADTFFVASHNPREDKRDTGGADVNHRGGRPGFVKVDGNTLTIPDYVGNFAFNTLGNFLVEPRAGLLFIDFDSGDLWQLTGTVEVILDLTDQLESFRGAERGWRFHLERGVCLRGASPLRWRFGEQSPNTRLTGNWKEAERNHAAEQQRRQWRRYRVSRIQDESEVIRSFYLEPADGGGLAAYQPGQFITLRVQPGEGKPLIRTYTLSSAPGDGIYRISVKREGGGERPAGQVSGFLHDSIALGDVIDVRAPTGRFWMDTRETRPAVLIAGAVGITPMMSMVRQVLLDGIARRHLRPVTVFHAVRTTAQRAFADELRAAQRASAGAVRYISIVGRPEGDDEIGRDFDVSGRIRPEILQSALPLADYDFYLCGPPSFMQAVYDMLRALGVRDARISAESFGPARLTRQPEHNAAVPDATEVAVADEAVVTFARSQVEQGWVSGDGTLLDFAEAHGLSPAFGCRSGACGSCSVRLLAGAVVYAAPPTHPVDDGQVLLCCAVPAKSDSAIKIDA